MEQTYGTLNCIIKKHISKRGFKQNIIRSIIFRSCLSELFEITSEQLLDYNKSHFTDNIKQGI